MTTRTEVSQENWHKCRCHFLEGNQLWCSRCTKCIQRGAIVYGYKMTKVQPKTKKNTVPTDQHTKLEEIENVAQWVKHQKIVHKSLPKDKTKWDEEVFRREHPTWKEDPRKKSVTLWHIVGRVCEECGEPVSRFAKLDLCDIHRREHERYIERLRKQRQRARSR